MSHLICGGCNQPNDRPTQRHCAKCHRIYMKEWRGQKTIERHPIIEAVKRDKRIKNKYNLTPSDQEAILREQGNACAICVIKFGNAPGRVPFVDHDHQTGNVRGLLCHKCNSGLGMFEDQPVYLDRAAEYLRVRSASAKVAIFNNKPKTTMASILEKISGVPQ
jgi:hypothetical protein